MTKEEYNIKLKQIEIDSENAKKELYKEYAISNNPYKIGDIISDHVKTIKIESWKYYKSFGLPQCVYRGIRINKDGTIAKKQDNNTIYQENINKEISPA